MRDIQELLGRTLVLVGHADDEAIACGVLLQRMKAPVIVYATDGAPEDRFFWEKYGSREAYVEIRRKEAARAMATIGITHIEFLPFRDQQLFRNIPRAVGLVRGVLGRTRAQAIVTLAYEGGHPDHDVCSFIAFVLGEELRLPVWEAPLYRRMGNGITTQEFVSSGADEVEVMGAPEEYERKRLLCAEYMSQRDVISNFVLTREKVRPQPRYDFTRPPHKGVLNYEAWHWNMTGEELCAAFEDYMAERSAEQEALGA